jgi:histidinol-phosphate aminotransferase
MKSLSKLIKPNILKLDPYTSARDEYQGAEGIFLDANENPYDLNYNRYPDPYQSQLKARISKWRSVDADRIFIGNGSDEIIDLLIRATCESGKNRILSLDPSYGMYKVSSAVNDIAIDLVALNTDLSVNMNDLSAKLSVDHKLIFINSPNNPNGGIIPRDIIEHILTATDNLVVIDEAYIDFSNTDSWCHRLDEFDNLIVLQTFSKSLGAAGIRVGMGFMNPYLIQILNKIKPPYNISIPNQEAALSRLDNLDKVKAYVSQIKASREKLIKSLNGLSIVEYVFPSEANFLLVRFYDHAKVFSTLIEHKIIVRDRSSNTNCENSLRISIGTEPEMEKLMRILKSI